MDATPHSREDSGAPGRAAALVYVGMHMPPCGWRAARTLPAGRPWALCHQNRTPERRALSWPPSMDGFPAVGMSCPVASQRGEL